MGLGGLLAGAVVAGTLLGLFIDSQAGTAPVFTVVGVGLGIVSRRDRFLASGPFRAPGVSARDRPGDHSHDLPLRRDRAR